MPPSPQAPALREAGQVTLAGNMRIMSPQEGASVRAAVALTDHIRLAATGVGAFDASRRGLYGELLAGYERFTGKFVQVGGLFGVGVGDVRARHPHCYDLHYDNSYCDVPKGYVDQAAARTVRYGLEGYFALHAPRVVSGGAGLRASVLDMRFHEVNDLAVRGRHAPLAFEPFVFVRAGQPWVQVEFQVRYTGLVNQPRYAGESVVAPDRLNILLGLRFVAGPGILGSWPRRQRKPRTSRRAERWAEEAELPQ